MMNPDDQSDGLRHAIAKAFCVLGVWDSPINDEKLRDIDVALSRCTAFRGVTDAGRAVILAGADAIIQRDGQAGVGNINEIIGAEHGREMVRIMIGLVLSWNPNADKIEQMMWHIPPDMGLSMDSYYEMWAEVAKGPAMAFANGKTKPPPLPATARSPESKEIHQLEQDCSELKALRDALLKARANPGGWETEDKSDVTIRKQIDKKLKSYWEKIILVQRGSPADINAKLHEAEFYMHQAFITLDETGLLDIMSGRSGRSANSSLLFDLIYECTIGLLLKGKYERKQAAALALLDKTLSIKDHAYARYLKAEIWVSKERNDMALVELDHILANFSSDDEICRKARALKYKISPSKKTSACFIATAACGSPMAAEVVLLSRFRDNVLLHSRIGRRFVSLYYQLSPPLATLIARFNFLQVVVRVLVLSPVIWWMRVVRGAR